MSEVLNNFNLTTLKILKTAGKICIKDTDVYLTPDDLKNIKAEYFRYNTEIFSLPGTYGPKINNTYAIPAGIYEITFDETQLTYDLEVSDVPFYYNGRQYNKFTATSESLCFDFNYEPSKQLKLSSSNLPTSNFDLKRLIYVPETIVDLASDTVVSWFKIMSPCLSYIVPVAGCYFELPQQIEWAYNFFTERSVLVDETITEGDSCHSQIYFPSDLLTYVDETGTDVPVRAIEGLHHLNSSGLTVYVVENCPETETSLTYGRYRLYDEGSGPSSHHCVGGNRLKITKSGASVSPKLLSFLIAIGANRVAN